MHGWCGSVPRCSHIEGDVDVEEALGRKARHPVMLYERAFPAWISLVESWSWTPGGSGNRWLSLSLPQGEVELWPPVTIVGQLLILSLPSYAVLLASIPFPFLQTLL